MIFRKLALLLLMMCGAACDPTPALFKAVAVGSPIIAGGYRSLTAADASEQSKIRTMPDKPAARAALAAHLKKYDVAKKSLDAATALTEMALDSAPVLKAAHDKQATMDLIGQLLKVYEDVRLGLQPFGVNIPRVVF